MKADKETIKRELKERARKALSTLGRTPQQITHVTSKITIDDSRSVVGWEGAATRYLEVKKTLSHPKNRKALVLHNDLLKLRTHIQNDLLPVAGHLAVAVIDPELFRTLEDTVTAIEKYFEKF